MNAEELKKFVVSPEAHVKERPHVLCGKVLSSGYTCTRALNHEGPCLCSDDNGTVHAAGDPSGAEIVIDVLTWNEPGVELAYITVDEGSGT